MPQRLAGAVFTFLVAVAALTGPAPLQACSIPVFRYALEHWAPDSYRVTIFHDAPLNDEQVAKFEELQKRCKTANAIVRQVSVSDDMDKSTAELWDALKTSTLPLAVIQLPASSQGAPLVWSGGLDELNPASLFNSPARTEVVRGLEGGESAIWVFLESGDEKRDNELFALLEAEVSRLQQTLKLQPIEEKDLAELSGSPTELKIKFSCLRVSRDDPAEAQTVNMLLSVEQDLRDVDLVDEPMVFPVFGRGRALYALIGDGINSSIIEEAARFLIGGCQCTVKAQNPGTDLLLTAGWETYVEPEEPVPPQYVAIPSSPASVAESESGESESASAPSEPSPEPVMQTPTDPAISPPAATPGAEQAEAPADRTGFPVPLAVILVLGGLILIATQWLPRSEKH